MRAYRTTALLPLILAAAPAQAASPAARQEVAIHFAFQAGGAPVECGKPIAGLGTTKVSAQLRDARFYVSNLALVDADGKETPVALDSNDWQNPYVALIDFENQKGRCKGTLATNDVIKGSAPAGKYKGLVFTVGVPSLGKDEDGKDVALNHSNLATAAAPLDVQGMNWGWQAGRKFIALELEPEGGVTRKAPSARLPKEAPPAPSAAEAARLEAIAKLEAPKETKEQPRVNVDGTITVSAWMMHFGSTGCKGDPLTGEIASCAAPNRIAVRFDTFDPVKQHVILDLAALLSGVDLTHDAGGATGCMSSLTDPECGPLYEVAGLRFKESAPDMNDIGKPSGVPQRIFRVGPKVLAAK
ncbi:hypothetical+protein [Methylocapsa aurea]|jgi:hypothetical protein|uniref:MbnP family copper-binding protein n=1 Tax=Methylocapsa aurea TaxID=663610 RepID=UPI003D18F37D